MADTASAPVKAAKAKKPRVKPTHPPTTEMIQTAIKTLKERNGSSLVAIKKAIAATYKVDVDKLAPFIKKSIKSSVASGALVQTKGKGASGSFKLAAKDKQSSSSAAAAAKKSSATKKPAAKKPKAGAASKTKKTPIKPKKPTAAKAKAAAAKKPAKVKTPSKAKKTTKAATKKPKSPKPKKTKAAAKKVAAKK